MVKEAVVSQGLGVQKVEILSQLNNSQARESNDPRVLGCDLAQHLCIILVCCTSFKPVDERFSIAMHLRH